MKIIIVKKDDVYSHIEIDSDDVDTDTQMYDAKLAKYIDKDAEAIEYANTL